MYYNLSMKLNMPEKLHLTRDNHTHVLEDNGCILFNFVFVFMVSKDPKTQNLSSTADKTITHANVGGLGSLVYLCGRSHFSFFSQTLFSHMTYSCHFGPLSATHYAS